MWIQWIFSVSCLAVAGYYAASLIARRGELVDGTAGGLPGAAALGAAPVGAAPVGTAPLGTAPLGTAPPRGAYELSHLAMALGMAAMFSPLGDPVPRLVGLIVFGMSAAWWASCALRAGLRADATGHHLVANLAMLFMVTTSHGHAAGAQAGSGHAGHTSAVGVAGGGAGGGVVSGDGWTEGPIGTGLALLLAAYFAVQALRSVRALSITQVPGPPPTGPAGIGTAGEPGPLAIVTPRLGSEQPRVVLACHGVMGIAMATMFGLTL